MNSRNNSLSTRPFLLATLVSSLLLGGCAGMMPKEIREMEKRTSALAIALRSEHPDFSHDFNVDGRNLHYVEIEAPNSKPLILFIHGSPGSWQVWADYLRDAELQKEANMIAVDRPGFGGSSPGEVERSLEQQCKDLAPVLNQAAPGQRVIVVGHSYGGPVAARLAMDFGGKITDLIILAGSIDPGQERTKWFQYPADWPPFSWMVPADLVVANREIRHLRTDLLEMLPLWPSVTQRVTLIQGEKDDLVPSENADFAAKVITHARSLEIIRIPNQNHFLPWNQYPLVKSQIIKHLK
jgi:pimeloyl-ACP methyl ester carboxylesterase